MKVLLAVDGSDTSWHAVSEALRILPLRQAEVVVIAVAEPPSVPISELEFGIVDVMAHRKIEARHRAEAAVRALEAAGVKADLVFREGPPASEILACAAEIRPDLIIMGSHGHGAFKRLVLGSVSDAVAHRWSGTVMVVRPPAPAADRRSSRTVASVMTRNPVCAQARERSVAVAEKMKANDTGFLPVLDGDRLIGVITDRDLVLRVLAEGCDPSAIPVGNICTEDPAWVAPEMPLTEAVALMERRRIRRLVVMEGVKIVGVVSLGDLAETDHVAADQALVEISRSTKTLAHRMKVG